MIIFNVRIPSACVLLAASLWGTGGQAFAQAAGECKVERLPVIEFTEGDTKISADHIERSGDRYLLRSNSEYLSDNRRILADELEVDTETEFLDARGNVNFVLRNSVEVKSDRTVVDKDGGTTRSEGVSYRLATGDDADPRGALVQIRGEADLFEVAQDGVVELQGGMVTNCPEGELGVAIEAERIVLNPATGQGEASKATIRLGDWRVLTVPKFWFPVTDRRLSGFLYPRIGENKRYGTYVEIPYYYNLAPNYDATATFTAMSKRGLQMGLELRHLSENSKTRTYFEALPSDNEYSNDDRSAMLIDYSWNDGPLYANLNTKFVSDLDYVSDFYDKFGSRSEKYLRQTADMHYLGDTFVLSSGVTRFIASHPSIVSNEPYDRVPWVQFDQTVPVSQAVGISTQLGFNRFRRESVDQGTRFDGDVSINARLSRTFGHISFGAGFKYIGYSDVAIGDDTSASDAASVPYFTAEGMVYVDQSVSESSLWQWSFAPRFKYVEVSQEKQAHLPDFDTSARRIENYEDLFAVNRYVGGDRFGNTRQLTAGVSLNLHHEEFRRPRFGLDIGQVFYYDDREALLKGEAVDTTRRSDIYVGMNALVDHEWSASASVLVDNENSNQVNQKSVGLQRETDKGIFRSMLRNADDDGKQFGNSLKWKFDSPWSVEARHLYSLEDDRTFETEVAVMHETCCWALGLEYGRDLDSDYSGDSYVSLIFTVLGYGAR